jgi:hypothetical protein
MRPVIAIATLSVGLVCSACYRSGEAASGGDTDTDYLGDYEVFGYIELSQQTDDTAQGGTLALSAAFYDEPYDPSTEWLVDTRTTPDGVPCRIYLVSGMDPDPPADPPAQLDGGAILVGNGGVWPDTLAVVYDGETYDIDRRTQWDADNPLPGWLTPDPFGVAISGAGSATVASFATVLVSAAMPVIAEQAPQPTDGAGNFVFAWDAAGASVVVVALHFNMDWDDSSIVCEPAPGASQILIPGAWLDELSWGGGGDLRVESREAVALEVGAALVEIGITRAHALQFYTAYE